VLGADPQVCRIRSLNSKLFGEEGTWNEGQTEFNLTLKWSWNDMGIKRRLKWTWHYVQNKPETTVKLNLNDVQTEFEPKQRSKLTQNYYVQNVC
jgi:hypothetical protein